MFLTHKHPDTHAHMHTYTHYLFINNVLLFFSNLGETDGRKLEELERLVWNPEHGLSDRQIDQFMVIARYDS